MYASGQVWDGLRDAFQPVRDLVDQKIGIVPKDVYEQVCHSKARVVSTVSLVRSVNPWAFFAIAGIDRGAPKWLLLDHLQAKPITHLEDVSEKLKELLTGDIKERQMDKEASQLIDKFLKRVLETETVLLPRKKQRALHEMNLVLDHYIKKAELLEDREWLEASKEAKRMLEIPTSEEERPDLDSVAEAWLDLIREAWYEKLMQRRRFKPLRLKDIRRELKNNPLSTEKIIEAFSKIPSAQPIHSRVVSAIVGVPD